jgi:hypothetical protein
MAAGCADLLGRTPPGPDLPPEPIPDAHQPAHLHQSCKHRLHLEKGAPLMSSTLAAVTTLAAVPGRVTASVHTLAAVCPTAPPGMQTYQDQVMGWVKWGVIGLILVTALVSVGAIGVGKIFAMPHASSRGAIGVAVAVIMAILFVTITAVINGVIGSGC